MMSESIPIQGWLEKEKQKPSLVGGTTVRRYFTIETIGAEGPAPTTTSLSNPRRPPLTTTTNNNDGEPALCYYAATNSPSPSGWFFLSDVESVRVDTVGRWIVLRHPTRSYRLRAPHHELHDVWYETLSRLCVKARIVPQDEDDAVERVGFGGVGGCGSGGNEKGENGGVSGDGGGNGRASSAKTSHVSDLPVPTRRGSIRTARLSSSCSLRHRRHDDPDPDPEGGACDGYYGETRNVAEGGGTDTFHATTTGTIDPPSAAYPGAMEGEATGRDPYPSCSDLRTTTTTREDAPIFDPMEVSRRLDAAATHRCPTREVHRTDQTMDHDRHCRRLEPPLPADVTDYGFDEDPYDYRRDYYRENGRTGGGRDAFGEGEPAFSSFDPRLGPAETHIDPYRFGGSGVYGSSETTAAAVEADKRIHGRSGRATRYTDCRTEENMRYGHGADDRRDDDDEDDNDDDGGGVGDADGGVVEVVPVSPPPPSPFETAKDVTIVEEIGAVDDSDDEDRAGVVGGFDRATVRRSAPMGERSGGAMPTRFGEGVGNGGRTAVVAVSKSSRTTTTTAVDPSLLPIDNLSEGGGGRSRSQVVRAKDSIGDGSIGVGGIVFGTTEEEDRKPLMPPPGHETVSLVYHDPDGDFPPDEDFVNEDWDED